MIVSIKSLRGQLILMIFLLSGIGMLCSIFIVNMNHQKSVIASSQATIDLIKQETITLTERHNDLLEKYGLGIQHNPEFRTALKNSNVIELERLLDAEFKQYYVTTEILFLNKIYVFDKNFNLISESSKTSEMESHGLLCSQLPMHAKKRRGADRIKLISTFCHHNNHTFNSVIVPVGALVPVGYLQIISNPSNFFNRASQKLGMPLSIETSGKNRSFQTEDWVDELENDQLAIQHHIKDLTGNDAATVTMIKDISKFNRSFSETRLTIIIIVGFVTLAGIAIFYYRFERQMLAPLNRLGKQLSDIEDNNELLGTKINEQGSQEIQALTNRFNTLTEKLSQSYIALETLAYRDSLTALANRAKLLELLDAYCIRQKDEGTPFCLLILDMDRFKTVNDAMGYRTGDQLLKQISIRLVELLNKLRIVPLSAGNSDQEDSSNLIARLNGDEFAIILPSINDPKDASVIAEKIIDILTDAYKVGDFNFNIGASIGIAHCPTNGVNKQSLMQHADIAMHHAKINKLGHALYDSNLSEHNQNILTMDTDLHRALLNEEFSLVFQPKINMKANKITSVETLLRWNHPELGFIPPDKFIAVAEQTGFINKITKWVIQAALKQKQIWEQQNLKFSISINLSARNLWDKNLIPMIRTELTNFRIMPQTVILELTESALMTDPEYAIRTLQKLRDLGLKISIDDFGTGYSSLSYLKKLPVNELKIDKSFVLDMINDEHDAVIVRSTIDLAHNMGLLVVAEGVESLEVMEILQKLSCDLGQGFYMGKPMNNEDLQQWLNTSPWGNQQSAD